MKRAYARLAPWDGSTGNPLHWFLGIPQKSVCSHRTHAPRQRHLISHTFTLHPTIRAPACIGTATKIQASLPVTFHYRPGTTATIACLFAPLLLNACCLLHAVVVLGNPNMTLHIVLPSPPLIHRLRFIFGHFDQVFLLQSIVLARGP